MKRRWKTISSLLLAVLIPLTVLLHMGYMGFSAIIGSSMYPALQNGDRWLTVTPTWVEPERFDIIGVDVGKDAYGLAKRIIGLPGEHVEFSDGEVYINGQRLCEPHLPLRKFVGGGWWLLGKDQFFVMGDNRADSMDSRTFGPIQRGAITKVFIWRIWRKS